jgi:hypothetical protein
MIKQFQLGYLMLLVFLIAHTITGSLNRAYDRNGDLLFTYADRVFAATWDYAASASSTLRQTPSVVLPISVLEETRHGNGLGTWAPNGQPVRLYSFGNGTNATLYAVIPGGGTWAPYGTALFLQVANRMGVKAGMIERGMIRSRAGGWSVATASLPGFVGNEGDLVLRLQTLIRGP